ncbi:major histocompatibility complex class I-related gene protein-like [Chanos chanos]|uniref:Major histocompatibility complex class I-related gene protein-like n=1 Tax=Chanos chanos TaxID=29144 RepID=A0A6J2WGN2_CHACN|nr:major histocompatibility complex class I-related gene protein-like [Chanos chanos]
MEYPLYFMGLFLMTVGAADIEPAVGSVSIQNTILLSRTATTPVIHNFSISVLCGNSVLKTYRDDGKVVRPEWAIGNKFDSFVATADMISENEKGELRTILQVMAHNQSDSGIHVIQKRLDCEFQNDSIISVVKYSYDGKDLLYFDMSDVQWVAERKEVTAIVEGRNTEKFTNFFQSIFFKLMCLGLKTLEECTDDNIQSPDINAFIQNSYKPHRLLLTCMATGFFPKNITMNIRKNQTQLPSEELRSLGVRPNNDGTYQLRKSVEIPDSDGKDYACYVDHMALKEPITLGFKYLRDSDPPRP